MGWEGPLDKGTATHSSILAWTIPLTEELGGLQSIGSQSRTRLKRLSMHTHSFLPCPLEREGEACNAHPGPPQMDGRSLLEAVSLAGRGGAGVETISEENMSG